MKNRHQRGVTVLELLIVTGIIAVLGTIAVGAVFRAQRSAGAVKSMNNLRQLAQANLAYAADNNGQFCPAQDRRNRIRWHGARASSGAAFDPAGGYLSPYLGADGRVQICPLFKGFLTEATFELGTGGYGYNAAYIGGTPGNPFAPERLANIAQPSLTVMFATTAFARDGGFQEYPFAEPFQWAGRDGKLRGGVQPSVHFRAGGNALVSWCDGHASAEPPNRKIKGKNLYGGDNDKHQIGWFGPDEENGHWNPRANAEIFRR